MQRWTVSLAFIALFTTCSDVAVADVLGAVAGLAFIALFTACSDGQTGDTDAGVHCGPGTVQ